MIIAFLFQTRLNIFIQLFEKGPPSVFCRADTLFCQTHVRNNNIRRERRMFFSKNLAPMAEKMRIPKCESLFDYYNTG